MPVFPTNDCDAPFRLPLSALSDIGVVIVDMMDINGDASVIGPANPGPYVRGVTAGY